MGQSPDQIAATIDRTREDLRANLQELETRVRSAADWRVQFDRHPLGMVVLAAVGGMLLAALSGRR